MTAPFDRMWAELEPVGRAPETGGYRRYAWTRTDHDLREWFAGECAARGLDVVEDRAGNQWAWWGDPDTTPGVVIGSHLDSVPDGGAFDGPLGVVSALAVVDELRIAGSSRTCRSVSSTSSTRRAPASASPAPARASSPARSTPTGPAALTDVDGVTMAEAWRAAGRDPDSLGPDPETVAPHRPLRRAARRAGPRRWSTSTHPVAVGTDIWPHGRWRVDFAGEANHAGTTRIEDRRDADARRSRDVVHATRSYAVGLGCVATVGKVHVQPGGVNAIASRVTAWLDARGRERDGGAGPRVEAVDGRCRALGGTRP